MTDQRPQLPDDDNQTGWCPNKCKAFVGFTFIRRSMIAPAYSDTAGTVQVARAHGISTSAIGSWLEVWRCQVCHSPILITEQRLLWPGKEVNEPAEERVHHRALLYPKPEARPLDSSIPEKIRSVFAEASKTEAVGAYRAAAVMYRAVVEEVCAERQSSGNNLKDKIKDLAQCGVDADLLADMDEARLLGNWSIHQGVTFAAAEVADVASLVEEALIEIYVLPAQRKAMRDARKARRDSVGQT